MCILIIGFLLNCNCVFILFSLFFKVFDFENKKLNVYFMRLNFGVLEIKGVIFKFLVCFIRNGLFFILFLVKYYIVVIFFIG